MSTLSSRLLVLAGRFFNSRPARALEVATMWPLKKAFAVVCGADTNVEGFFKALDEENDRVIASWMTGHLAGPGQSAAVLDLARWAVGISTDASITTLRRLARFETLIGRPPSAEQVAAAEAELLRVSEMLKALLPLGVMAQGVDLSDLDWSKAKVVRLKTDAELAADAAARPSEAECLAAAKKTICKEPEELAREIGWLPPQQSRVFVDLLTEGSVWTIAACQASLAGPRPVRGPFCWWKKGTPLPNGSAETQQAEEWARAHHRLATALNFDLDAGIDMKVGERAT